MTNRSRLAAVALAALTVSAFSITSASAIFIPPRKPAPTPSHSSPSLDCRAKGSDFWILNFGSTVIDSGRQIAWSSSSTGDSGTVLLPGPLAPGQEVRLADVLSDDAMRGAPCTADFV